MSAAQRKENQQSKQLVFFFFPLWFLLSANPTMKWVCEREMGAAGRVGVGGVGVAGAELPGGCASLGPHSAVFEEKFGEGVTASRGHAWPKSRAPPRPLLPHSPWARISHHLGRRRLQTRKEPPAAPGSRIPRLCPAAITRQQEHIPGIISYFAESWIPCSLCLLCWSGVPIREERGAGRVSAVCRTLPPQVLASPSLESAWLQRGPPDLAPDPDEAPSPAQPVHGPCRDDTGVLGPWAEKTKKPWGKHLGSPRHECILRVVRKGEGEPQLTLFIKENKVPRVGKIWGLLTQKSEERLWGLVKLKSFTWHHSVEYGMNIPLGSPGL